MPITTEDTVRWLQQLAQVLHENREYLTQLDSPIGDADHGINMDRGFKAVMDKLPTVANMDIGSILKTVGTTLVSTVGGASGPLYGTAFLRAGMAAAGKYELYEADYTTMLEAALEGIRARGKARFVFGGALTSGLIVAGIFDVIDNVFMAGLSFPCCQILSSIRSLDLL